MAEEKQNVTIACTATGQPSPKTTWSKAVGSLPGGRIKIRDGTMKIYSVTKKDGGIYICKAVNILGSVTDTAQLIVYSPLRFKVRPPQQVTPYYMVPLSEWRWCTSSKHTCSSKRHSSY